jgi:putative FmdB family regulatory protein
MATYEYECSSCKKKHEVQQKMSDEPLTLCPFCKKETLKRIFSRDVSLQFKGSGFYITDYQNKPTEEKPSGGCNKGSCGCH